MYIDKFKKIVIKIGSSILVDKKGKPKKIWLKEFAKDIKNLIKKKKQIVIVSSGAIAMGCEYLGIKKNGLKVDKSQAIASIGQIELMDFLILLCSSILVFLASSICSFLALLAFTTSFVICFCGSA